MPRLVSPGVGRVTGQFGPRKAPTAGASTYHKGTDIADGDDLIVAPTDGTVIVSAFEKNGAGNYVTIDHGMGVRTRHHHLKERRVAKGARVVAGQVIGVEGMTGIATGVHLHTEVHINGVQVNPSAWYAEHGVTLGSSGEGWIGATPTPASSVEGYSQATADYQDRQNRYGNAGLLVDGLNGPRTKAWRAWTEAAQRTLNLGNSTLPDLTPDGDYGAKTHARTAEAQRRNGRPVTGILSDADIAHFRRTWPCTLAYRPRTS